MFRVIIAGSREFDDFTLLVKRMDALLANVKDDVVIISGTARGADSLGERYALLKGYKVNRYPANWDKFGKAAGFIRNEQMAQNADALVAFWDGKSRGTKNMIEIARRYNLRVRVVRY